jgi:hypothetical protein
MSVYQVKLFKDGLPLREWQVETAPGADPEEEITWTERDSDEMFEERVVSAVEMSVPGWPVASNALAAAVSDQADLVGDRGGSVPRRPAGRDLSD